MMDPQTLEACAAWAEARFAPETEAQRWIRSELEARGMPLIQVSALEGRTLALLAAATGARRLLEVGTLGGYSALWLVSLLGPEASLDTIERDPERAELAREAVRRAGEETRIRVHVGDARAVLAELARAEEPEPFDLLFIDADKAAYPEYLERATRLLRPGGWVLGDNAFWDGRILEAGEAAGEADEDPDLRGILEFDRRLAEDPRLEAVVLPIRDGLAVARFKG